MKISLRIYWILWFIWSIFVINIFTYPWNSHRWEWFIAFSMTILNFIFVEFIYKKEVYKKNKWKFILGYWTVFVLIFIMGNLLFPWTLSH